jgi:hypothetical protein
MIRDLQVKVVVTGEVLPVGGDVKAKQMKIEEVSSVGCRWSCWRASFDLSRCRA